MSIIPTHNEKWKLYGEDCSAEEVGRALVQSPVLTFASPRRGLFPRPSVVPAIGIEKPRACLKMKYSFGSLEEFLSQTEHK